LLTSWLQHPGPNDLIVLPEVVSTSFQSIQGTAGTAFAGRLDERSSHAGR
jgi:hypothetical protein